jgi:hypothetical protein
MEDGGAGDDDHARVAQTLRASDGVTPVVAGDVLGSIQDLAHVSGPSEPLVQEVVESDRIPFARAIARACAASETCSSSLTLVSVPRAPRQPRQAPSTRLVRTT